MSGKTEEPNFWGRVVRGYHRVQARRADKKIIDQELKVECKAVEDKFYREEKLKLAEQKGVERASNKGGRFGKLKKFGDAFNKAFAPPPQDKRKKQKDPFDFM